MSIEIKSKSLDQKRMTFDHIAEKLGEGKKPSRYHESVLGFQNEEVFHYRPTWQPEYDIFDARRTEIKMEDFQDLLDPRQYYYGTYVMQRSKQQEAQEKNFSVVEKRGLLENIDPQLKEKILKLIIPLRHVEWGANTNNTYIVAYGFETPITVAADFQAMDRLGNAQYITRLGLILGQNDPSILDQAKSEWLESPMWQPLRKVVEDSFVIKDWFELHVVQNYLIDNFIHPLIFKYFENDVVNNGGASLAMVTEFFIEWFKESQRWTDSTIKVAVSESEENRLLVDNWIKNWKPEVLNAASQLADYAFTDRAGEIINTIEIALDDRSETIGISK